MVVLKHLCGLEQKSKPRRKQCVKDFLQQSNNVPFAHNMFSSSSATGAWGRPILHLTYQSNLR